MMCPGCGPAPDAVEGGETGAQSAGSEAPVRFLSGVKNNHVHALYLSAEDVKTPPPWGIARLTDEVDGHSHALVLTREDLRLLGEGERVRRETTEDAGHVHAFELWRGRW